MNPKHQKQIDEYLAKREAEKQADKVSHEMNPVAWHLAELLEVDSEKITRADCCYFIGKVGGDYLERKLRGVGATIARRLCITAEEWRKENE